MEKNNMKYKIDKFYMPEIERYQPLSPLKWILIVGLVAGVMAFFVDVLWSYKYLIDLKVLLK